MCTSAPLSLSLCFFLCFLPLPPPFPLFPFSHLCASMLCILSGMNLVQLGLDYSSPAPFLLSILPQ